MLHIRALLVSACLVALLPSCASTTVNFSPFDSVDAQPPPVTGMAIEIRPGDRRFLTKANPKVLGWVSSKGDIGDDAVKEAARIEAARRGGTHILLRGAKKEFDVEDLPIGPIGTQQIEESQRLSYVVLRVSPDNWADLPEVLRPKALPVAAKP